MKLRTGLLLITAALVALIAPVNAHTEQRHGPDLGSDILILKKPFTMKACTDRVADVVRNHTGAGLRIDSLPSGTGLIGDDINIVIRCVPNLKAIIFMAAGSNLDTVGKTLAFYSAVFEFEVKQIGDGK